MVEVADIAKLADQIAEIEKAMIPAIAKRDEDLKAHGAAAEALGKRVDELGTALTEARKEMQDALVEVERVLKEARRPDLNPGQGGFKSLGTLFVESETYKEFQSKGQGVVWDTPGIPVTKLFDVYTKGQSGRAQPAFLKALQAGDLDGLILPDYSTTPILEPLRQLRIRDLLNVATTNSDTIYYPEELGWKNLMTVLTDAGDAADMTLTVESTAGFYAGQVIDVGGQTAIVDSVDSATGLTLTEQLGDDIENGSAVTARTFGGTPEGAMKPQASTGFRQRNVPVITLAHWIAVTRQALADASQIRSYIDRQLVYGLRYTEEWQILYGLGAGATQLEGILTNPEVPTYLWSTGEAGDTKIDAIRRAMTVARMAEYPVDGAVLNPLDWADIQLAKGSDGHYIWVNVTTDNGFRIWGLPVVETTAIAAGTGLIGSFSLGATLWDREQATIRTSEHHEDFFGKNLVAILGEAREALAVQRPKAFCEIDFDSAPAAS